MGKKPKSGKIVRHLHASLTTRRLFISREPEKKTDREKIPMNRQKEGRSPSKKPRWSSERKATKPMVLKG